MAELTGPSLERRRGGGEVCKSEEQRLWPRGARWPLAALLPALPSSEVVTVWEAWRLRAEFVGCPCRG